MPQYYSSALLDLLGGVYRDADAAIAAAQAFAAVWCRSVEIFRDPNDTILCGTGILRGDRRIATVRADGTTDRYDTGS